MPTLQLSDTSLYYEKHGEGHPVFFIHGGGGNSMAFYQQVPHFRDRYQVITVDLRGFKHSHCAPEKVHPRYFPDDIRAIMDAEGMSRAAFVCQSLGAWAGLPIAVRTPERVLCLFINGSPTPAYSEQNWSVIQRANGIFLGPDFSRGAGVGWNRETLKTHPDLIFLYSQIKALNPPFDSSTMMDDSIKLYPADFENYHVPTVVAGGSHDDFLNPQSHFHAASLIPGADTYTFKDSGHSAYFEQAGEFNEVVDRFLLRHVGARALSSA